MRRIATVIVSGLLLAACSTQRPLWRVAEDGEYWYKAEQFERSATDFGEYVTRKPDHVEMRFNLARSLVAAGQPREALSHLSVCTDVEPLNDKYLDLQARALFDAGEREQLVEILARAASERGRVQDFVRLGVFSQRLGNLDEAEQALLTAAKIDRGRSVIVQRSLADFYGSIGDTDRQRRRLRMAYYLQPDNLETIEAARALGEIPGPTFGLVPEEVRLTNVPE
ncbi:MAG: hypothetical protein WAZ94_11730 [Phycisphaerales bacterium]